MIRQRLLDRSDFLLLQQGILGSCGYGVPIYRTPQPWYAPDRVSGVVDLMSIRRIDSERCRLDQRRVDAEIAKLRRLRRTHPAFWRRAPSAIKGLSPIRNRLLEN